MLCCLRAAKRTMWGERQRAQRRWSEQRSSRPHGQQTSARRKPFWLGEGAVLEEDLEILQLLAQLLLGLDGGQKAIRSDPSLNHNPQVRDWSATSPEATPGSACLNRLHDQTCDGPVGSCINAHCLDHGQLIMLVEAPYTTILWGWCISVSICQSALTGAAAALVHITAQRTEFHHLLVQVQQVAPINVRMAGAACSEQR